MLLWQALDKVLFSRTRSNDALTARLCNSDCKGILETFGNLILLLNNISHFGNKTGDFSISSEMRNKIEGVVL